MRGRTLIRLADYEAEKVKNTISGSGNMLRACSIFVCHHATWNQVANCSRLAFCPVSRARAGGSSPEAVAARGTGARTGA